MASSPLRAPAAAAGQQQSRLMEMQKKFQQKHLAAVAAMNNSTKSMKLSNNTTDPPAPPAGRLGGVGVGQQQRQVGKGVGSIALGNGSDSVVQVDVKGKQQQRPVGNRINGKTATVSKKPLTTTVANGNGGAGRGSKNAMAGGKPVGGAANHTNRLLLPPVVQPTVINALAAGAGAAAAVASVNAATVAGAQKPLVRAAKLPPTNHGTQQKPTAPPRRVVVTPQSSKVTAAASRQPIPKRAVPAPAMSPTRPQPVKKQLSMDRGPPAQGMARCSLCARDFKTDRLPKHEEVCRKRNRKRKVFDASRQRLEGVAAETGMDVSSLKKMSQKSDQQVADKLRKKKDAWRRKHDQLVRNVRAARAVQRHLAAGGSLRDLPPELENDATNQDDEVDSGLVKCPHCNRTFNEAAAERHVPLCAERQRNAAARLQNKKR